MPEQPTEPPLFDLRLRGYADSNHNKKPDVRLNIILFGFELTPPEGQVQDIDLGTAMGIVSTVLSVFRKFLPNLPKIPFLG